MRAGASRAVAVLLPFVLLAGCGVPEDEEPRRLDAADAPFRIFETASPAAEGDGRVALYFVRGDFVVLQTRPVERSTSISELLDLLLEGPTPEQVAAGTRSAIPTSLEVESIEVGPRDVAVVTLAGGETQIGTSPLGFAQIVATLTAPGRAKAVRFRLDGQDLPVPRGDGSLTSDPVDRSDYAEVLRLQSPPATPPGTSSASPAPTPS